MGSTRNEILPTTSSDQAHAPLCVDLHVHTHASAKPVFPSLAWTGCPESYAQPERVYELARRRGMDVVAITDHDTIDGAMALVDSGYPDVLVGEEVSVCFPEDGCAVHALLWGVTPEIHEEIDLLDLRSDIYTFAAWLKQTAIPHAVAHPLHAQNGRLTVWHLERLALLFHGFETLNGAHGALYAPSERFLDTLTPRTLEILARRHALAPLYDVKTPLLRTAGSDDHSLLNVGRTWTRCCAPSGGAHASDRASAVAEALREARTHVKGAEGSPDSLAHQILAVAAQHAARHASLLREPPARLLASRLCSLAGAELAPPSRAALALDALRTRLTGGTNHSRRLLAVCRASLDQTLRAFPDFVQQCAQQHQRGVDPPIANHERFSRFTDALSANLLARIMRSNGQANRSLSATPCFDAVIGFAAAHALIAPDIFSMFYQHKDAQLHERIACALDRNWPVRPADAAAPSPINHAAPIRLALFTDTVLETNGVASFVRAFARRAQERSWNVRVYCAPAHGLDQVAALGDAFRPMKPVASFQTPGYHHLRIGVPPALPMLRDVLQFNPDSIHISTPGPTGALGLAAASIGRKPALGVHHTDYPAYVQALLGDQASLLLTRLALRYLYDRLEVVFARSAASVAQLRDLGVPPSRQRVLPAGVDTARFTPTRRNRTIWKELGLSMASDSAVALYVGRISEEKNIAFLVDVWTRVHRRATLLGGHIHLVVVGDGPARAAMQRQLTQCDAHFPGERFGDELATLYASADFFLFPSTTDTLGQVVMEAQASGLPAIVSDTGGPATIVRNSETGFILPGADAAAWADAVIRLASNRAVRQRLGAAATQHMATHALDASLDAFFAAHEDVLRVRRQRANANTDITIDVHVDAAACSAMDAMQRAPAGAGD